MIPVPGEWHWTWHIIKGIFVLYYDSILLPCAKAMGYSTLDREAKNFHYAEDLLQIVTIGILGWIESCLPKLPAGFNVIDWMHNLKQNKPLYEMVYACYYYFVPYWVTRAAIK